MGEQSCKELYAALENLVGDLYLLGFVEITLEDIYAGSCSDAMKILKRNQQWRDSDKGELAIGQLINRPDVPTSTEKE